MNDKLKEAIISFQSGNKEAFTDIYNLQYNHIYYIALQHARHVEEAQDIAQEVFIEIYKSLHQLKEVTHFNAWVNKVTYSYFIKTVRSKSSKSRVHLNNDIDLEEIIESSNSGPSRTYITEEILGAVEVSFDLLSPAHKEVARMRFFDEMSIGEISDAMDVPTGTVKSRIHTVRKILQEGLQTEYSQMRIAVAPLVYAFFKNMLESADYISNIDVTKELGAITAAGTIILHKVKKPKIPKSTLGNVVVGTTIIATPLVAQNVISPVPPIVESVSYKDGWTKDDLLVNINYKKTPKKSDNIYVKQGANVYTLENISNMTIRDNGNVDIFYEDELLYSFVVNNIDKVSANLDMVVEGNHIEVLVQDEHSGINFETIKVIEKNGFPIDFKVTDESIIFDKETFGTYTITGEDNAGNVFEASIVSEEIK